ncbi:MAG: gamma carbonic anhydrase family protein [Clostridium luticellarii]|jgi:carbonic anhydrase/acetyltransferase-like protein (isoleucine patch superfamily)|uniref:2,3,4,5-tetrahydropyridine-2,6-dicarboxylate N-acetyltransferase n=1 Tax=Clostridium luticellarii TaxID=1691940 RepID=A0A2T0BM89_9CLOT|nr:gamma carbonic anhydrase family protein [Clostridium luticellarii]MCI1996571.1 gamma carbonic anhydrase family protein [Clostridium luticellarii]MCI2040886.1 gamma carbonic anhydrase family protein [Clostridium luticellarii]PRR84999.1 2,3,4,5-tetrahydropyridine-2,6-dicarboxylate N-acetyltransferase [Clostridium luticellarii]
MIRKFENYVPEVDKSCFVADNAEIIGKVKIHEDASIWFGAVLRGDVNYIYVGKGSNVQDNCTLHTSGGMNPVEIGEYVTVGHNAIIHGGKVGKYSLIGMGSIILDNAEIGEQTIIGAGSLVTKNKKIPSGVMCMGSPARVVRKLTEEEKEFLKKSAEGYIKKAESYK